MRMDENTSYMIFVLGFDLLQKELTATKDCPCDWAYRVCTDIYNEFVKSEEFKQDKSEYSCMQDWIENNQGAIDNFINGGF